MNTTTKLGEQMEKAITRAYLMGQNYWRLADSESWADHRRSNDIQDKFDALRSETVSVAGAQVSILEDEIDRLRAELQARKWMPIETAPKDGTVIELWHEEFGRSPGCYWGLPTHYCGEMGSLCDSDWHDIEPGWVDDMNEIPFPPTEYSHWMPLPPAPPHGEKK